MTHVTSSRFKERFVSIVLGGRALPRKRLDRNVLLRSAVQGLDPGRGYSEPGLNDVLLDWTARFGEDLGLDHVTLRRFLVDEGYLIRDAAGEEYVLGPARAYTFDGSLEEIDLDRLVREARRTREARKLRHGSGGS